MSSTLHGSLSALASNILTYAAERLHATYINLSIVPLLRESMPISCLGYKTKSAFSVLESRSDMDQLDVRLHDGKNGQLSCDKTTIELCRIEGSSSILLFTAPIWKVLDIKLFLESQAHKNNMNQALEGLLKMTILMKTGTEHKLKAYEFRVEAEKIEATQTWVDAAITRAYVGVKRGRRIRLLVNPVGGKGKAKSLVSSIALPVFASAGCAVEVLETQYAKHAEEIAQTMSLDCDVLAAASGDGIIHELINGLASRDDASEALSIPLVPIPTGSANAMSLNLLGLEDGFDIALASLNAIKGKPMPLDICSVTQGDKRRFSFMSIASGLMCDVDLGTENLRWMGDGRFIYGFIKGIFFNYPMRCKIHLKVETADKGLMIQRLNDHRQLRGNDSLTQGNLIEDRKVAESRIPPVRMLKPGEDWVTLESGTFYGAANPWGLKGKRPSPSWQQKGSWKKGEGILYIYTGLQPYVARDLLQFPVCVPGEGLIDVVVQSLVPRHVMAQSIAGASEGKQFYLDSQHYYKASAFVLEPEEENGLISVDGEALGSQKLSVEVVPKMATTLSLYGAWAESGFARRKNEQG